MGKHYVCSDIHGYLNRYLKLLDEIRLEADDTLYILGDVIDRGPDSFGLLKDIMNRPNVELFLGNHELMMHDFLLHKGMENIWFLGSNGGKESWSVYQRLSAKEQKAILDYISKSWLQKLLEVDGQKFWLSHSSILDPCVYGFRDVRFDDPALSWDDVFRVVWNSPFRQDEFENPGWYYTDDYIHLIGHVPVQRMRFRQPPCVIAHHLITNNTQDGGIWDIDGGCATSPFAPSPDMDFGGLYCLRLEKEADGSYWSTFIQ
ncbi:MAG: fructose-bisphosphatase class III [Blautia sp.]|nr:fructose-bisphosphatase class III [Blautia sp.]